MKVVVTPEACKGEGAKYTGTVEMRPPFIEERWAYLEECGVVPSDDSELEPKAKSEMAMSRALIKKMVPKLPAHVVTVDICESSTGAKLQSLDDLKSDPDATGIIMELCAMLLKGFKPGKP